MKIRLRRSLLSLAAVLTVVFVVTGCANEVPEVTVFAAASLADVLQPLGERFEAQQGIDVKFSFGGSWALAQQVVRGAPADAFLAAGSGPMDAPGANRHTGRVRWPAHHGGCPHTALWRGGAGSRYMSEWSHGNIMP